MNKKKTLFSNDAWRELKKRLNHLAAICCPPSNAIRPKISFKHSSYFGFEDVLKWGISATPIEPSELKKNLGKQANIKRT